MDHLKPLAMIYETLQYRDFFHVSPTRNNKSILSKGLVPSIGDRSGNYGERHDAIYLFGSFDDMDDALSNWLADEFDEDESLSAYRVRLPVDWPLEEVEWEYQSKVPIPPEYITLLDYEI